MSYAEQYEKGERPSLSKEWIESQKLEVVYSNNFIEQTFAVDPRRIQISLLVF